MLATRIDQENALKGFSTKTPGNRKAPKTPFKVPLNDENAPFRAGKSVLKTNGKGDNGGLTLGKKGTTLDKNAFVTPAGPRIRPALGQKTTNAKANAFLSPAAQSVNKSPTKTVSPRLRRAKVKVLQAEPISLEADDGELDYEFMAPRGEPLPDYPSDDEFGPNKTYPQLAPENLTRGLYSTYFNPVDDNGVSLIEKEQAARKAKHDKWTEDRLNKSVEDSLGGVELSVMEDLGLAPKQSNMSPKKFVHKQSMPGTLLTKTAASALSRSSKAPSYAAATNSSKTRAPAGLSNRKTRVAPVPSTDPSTMRFAAASAASRSTIGYSQGRAASQQLRKPATDIFRDDAKNLRSTSESSLTSHKSSSSGEFQAKARDTIESLRLHDLHGDEHDESFALEFVEEDEYVDFQLTMPSPN